MKKNGAGSPANETKRPNWFARHKIATAVLAVVLVGLAVGGYFAARALNAFNDPASVLTGATAAPTASPTASESAPAETSAAETPAPTETPEPELQTDRNDVNILVLGVAFSEHRQAMGRADKQTDCIILVHIENLKANEKPVISMISIPRDTLLANLYDDNGDKVTGNLEVGRINTAFALGGIEGAKKTISHYLGDIPIDKYVLFDMQFVQDFIDTVGGVDVPVKDLKSKTVTIKADIGTFTYKNNTTMHMDGKMALTYARDRHNTSGGDYTRGDHMQDVMKALLSKLKDKGNLMSHAWELYQMFSKQLTTDIDDYQEVAAVAGIAMRLDMDGIVSKKIVRFEDMHMYEGMSVFFSDPGTKKAVLKEVFGIDYTMPNEETWESITAPIRKVRSQLLPIINKAKKLLEDNAGKYTAAEAAPLRKALDGWSTASYNSDTDRMKKASKTVQAEYTKLKAIIDAYVPPSTDPP